MLLIQTRASLGHNGVEDILISDEGKYLKIAPKIDAPNIRARRSSTQRR